MLGTNCPIPPGTNHTYHFQVKDQIGSFLYYPSTSIHKANGAFGGLHINSRLLIPVPYDAPEDDFTVIVKIGEIVIEPIVLNMTFRNFVEIIFENHEEAMQSWHLDGYSFFTVA